MVYTCCIHGYNNLSTLDWQKATLVLFSYKSQVTKVTRNLVAKSHNTTAPAEVRTITLLKETARQLTARDLSDNATYYTYDRVLGITANKLDGFLTSQRHRRSYKLHLRQLTARDEAVNGTCGRLGGLTAKQAQRLSFSKSKATRSTACMPVHSRARACSRRSCTCIARHVAHN